MNEQIKKLAAVAILLGLTAAYPAQAEYKTYTRKINCAPLTEVLEDINSTNIKEVPVWIGTSKDLDIKYSVLVNKKNDTWTIIQYNNGAACVISIGQDNQFLDFGKKN
jgi:hypothetical protein